MCKKKKKKKKNKHEAEKPAYSNIDTSRGGRMVMARSPWDCRTMIAQYLCQFTGTVQQPCDSSAGDVLLSQVKMVWTKMLIHRFAATQSLDKNVIINEHAYVIYIT